VKYRIAMFALGMLLLQAGCATRPGFRPSMLGQVRLGMPKPEALALLGPPREAGVSEIAINSAGDMRKREVLRYAAGSGRGLQYYVVLFSDGQVEDFGPQVGRLELEGVFSPYPAETPLTAAP